MLMDVALIIGGVLALALSGDKLVEFAAALAARARVTPAVIGLTVVAAGTSFPELVVSVVAAKDGTPDIAIANVVGSNISNLTLILGFVAVVATIPVPRPLLTLEYPVMVGAAALVTLLSHDGMLTRPESVLMLSANVVFVLYSVWLARQRLPIGEVEDLSEQVPAEASRMAQRPGIFLIVGLLVSLVGLSLGARMLVSGASSLAHAAGLSDRVIGLTVVAIGTSLPELVASLMAARRGQHSMALTNLVGSNIFNSLMILGATGLVTELPVAAGIASFDMWVMQGVGLVLWVVTWQRKAVSRATGAVLLAAYALYTVQLF